MSVRDKWVRRFTVSETGKHKNFTIYKITSVLFPLEHSDAATIVSVWKRYSDVQRLHKGMRSLHSGLYLSGSYPILPSHSYFKRFQKEVIEERAHSIKRLLDFIAQHRLLFASTEFVHFLQTGYPEPKIINKISIESSHSLANMTILDQPNVEETDRNFNSDIMDTLLISRIKIHEPADIEVKETVNISPTNSLQSIDSLSISSDLYEEIKRVVIDNKSEKMKPVLPDLINFEMPSTSKVDDKSNMDISETDSMSSTVYSSTNCNGSTVFDDSMVCGPGRSSSLLSLSKIECKTRTKDSYIFEAGHILNLATRCEDIGDYKKAFEYYKKGIEKLLNGVNNDDDPERQSLIKQNIKKYLTYAETVYEKHLPRTEGELSPKRDGNTSSCPLPLSMLQRPYEELSVYKVIGILGPSVMLVHNKDNGVWYAMKVIPKVPQNRKEFEDYYSQNSNETKNPVLPTAIPYMVTLHSYVNTENLIFLVTTYSPGVKLIEYIKSHTKTNSKPRNLSSNIVFSGPKCVDLSSAKDLARDDVTDLVKKSQNLILNIDRVLNTDVEDCKRSEDGCQSKESLEHIPEGNDLIRKNAMPPSAICKWGAEILTAIESLHETGVVCRDLNPNNILLGHKGQAILTYFVGYAGSDMALTKLQGQTEPGDVNLYIAPEVYLSTLDSERRSDEKVCDFWSFGAIMYELLCGESLSHHHRSVFTSHTELVMPPHVPMEAKSLLSQLLTFDPAERLGSGTHGIEEIKNHPYFKSIDWVQIRTDWVFPDD